MGDKGKKLADHDRDEHTVSALSPPSARLLTTSQQVKKDLVALEGLEVGTAEFDQLMNKVMDHLKHHNDDEERDDLPALEPVRLAA